MGAATPEGACDTRNRHAVVAQRGGTAIIPIGRPMRRNGRARKEDGPAARARNDILRAARHFGGAMRRCLTGCDAQNRAEARMVFLMSFGDRPIAQDPERRAAEIHVRGALTIRFSALSQAQIVRVASTQRQRRKLGPGKVERPRFFNGHS